MAINTLGHLLAAQVVRATNAQERLVRSLAQEVQHVTEESVILGCVDQGYTGQHPVQVAAQERMQLHGISHKNAKKGVVLLACRWGIARSFGWVKRFRRLGRDYGR